MSKKNMIVLISTVSLVFLGYLFIMFVILPRNEDTDIILINERNAYRDSLAIAKYEKQVLIQQLDTLQKIKIDEIRSVDSIPLDSLLLYISNFNRSGQ